MSTLSTGDAAYPTYVYVRALVDELRRAGVRHVVVCPGSRSTPLAMVLAEQNDLRLWMHVDERSAAFFALGLAKRSGQTVGLLCTSGTAAANFLPAIVEAHLTHIPLLVLTADRPHELRDNGAPQAIDQNRLYGAFVKWFVDVALPEATPAALRYIRTLANRAVALTQALPPGPVHLNMPFREPLVPGIPIDRPYAQETEYDRDAWLGRSADTTYISVCEAPLASIANEQIAQLVHLVQSAPRGLIVVGPSEAGQDGLALPLVRLAQCLGYPVLADPLSQLRCGSFDHTPVLTGYDAFLRIASFIERMEPQCVLRFGAMPTSKSLLLYLKRYAHCPQIVVDGNGGWLEPTQLASQMVHADPVMLCHDLLAALNERPVADEWFTAWQQTDQRTQRVLQDAIQDFTSLFEGRVFTELAELLPEGATLYVGNSMPVRDLDTFFWGNERHIRLLGNRGANGIDGVISSALGVSAASDPGEPMILVIGDLSFFHDLNGLLAARLHQLNLIVVLINNDGGGIFSFLPQAEHPEHFEQLFGTPTGLDFAPVVQMYGGTFQRIESWEAFREAMRQGFTAGGLRVLELPTERASNVSMHRHLWQVVDRAL